MRPSFFRRHREDILRLAGAALAVLLIVLAAKWILGLGSGQKAKPFVQQITMVQPPPPPPPPPEQKIMEKPKEVIEPPKEAKVQEDVKQVSEQPSPNKDASPAATPDTTAGLNTPADAGADNFRLAAGKGGGFFGGGGGGGGGSWAGFVETHIRTALMRDKRTRSAGGYLEVASEIDDRGVFRNARLLSTTGNRELDEAIRDVLANLPPLTRGRPPGIDALTVTGINMKPTSRG